MLQLKNKIIAFAFLLIMLAPVLFSLQFMLEQNLIQEEVEEKMQSVTLTAVSISLADLVWMKKGKEVLLDGKLFDIRSFIVKNNEVILLGFFDDKETELIENYNGATDDNNNNPLSRLAWQFLLSPIIKSNAALTLEARWQTISNQYYSYASVLPESPYRLLLQPPKI